MIEPTLESCAAIAQGLYLEGLAIDFERDVIWYSDVIGGGIHGVKPDGSKLASFNEGRMWTGGVLMNADGYVLSSGQGGIMWNDPETGSSGWLVDRIEGEPVNGINEMVPDGLGGIWFGTTDIERVISGEATRPTAIHHLTVDGHLTCVAQDIGFANGLMFDAGRMLLYCNDTFRGTWSFDVAPDRTLGGRLFIFDKEDADGMALDGEGNLWITGFRSGHFTRITPAGARLGDVPTPAGSITQLRFGGPDGRDCYFNSVPSDGGDTLKEGGEISAANSFLYKARCSAPGRPLQPAQFRLR
jgi:sugar lactone lactonase YvrE